jgi:hypothetical protein
LVPITKDWPTTPLTRQLIDIALLVGYIAAFLLIFCLYFVAHRRQHQERFLDYRALAEALRVAVFWKLVGVEHAADAYPIKMPRELAWVKTCLLMQELHGAAEEATRGSLDAASYDWIRRIWIGGQASWFRKKRPAHLGAAEWRVSWSTYILLTAVVLACILLALVSEPVYQLVGRGKWAHDLFLFTIGAMPGIAAVLVGYSEKRAFNAMARQYDRMAELFARALEVLPESFAPANVDLARGALRELGAEAMRENAEWVSIFRQRPISLPPG